MTVDAPPNTSAPEDQEAVDCDFPLVTGSGQLELESGTSDGLRAANVAVEAAGEVRQPGVPRMGAWAAAAALATLLLVVSLSGTLPVLVLTLAVMGAVALTPDRNRAGFGVAALLPAGFVVSAAWALCWGLAIGAMGRDAWGDRSAALAGVAVYASMTGVVAWHRRGRIHLVGADRAAVVATVALAGFFSWVIVGQPFALWSRINSSGTDFLRHLRMLRALHADGALHFGQDDYPSVLHAWMALLSSALGSSMASEALWRAIAPTCLLMLAAVLLGLVGTADRLTRILMTRVSTPGTTQRRTSRAGVAAGLVTGVVFIQTAWFGVFLNLGHIMNILVGVCLVALLGLVASARTVGPLTGCLIGTSAVLVTANAWQFLIPVVGLGALPWIVVGLRTRGTRRWAWLIALVGGLMSLHGLGLARGTTAGDWTSVVTVSGLFAPDWWWWVGLALSGVAIVAAFRAGLRSWAIAALGMLAGGFALTAGLFLITHSTWDLMLYYPVKTLWTVIIVTIPLAASVAVWLLMGLWQRSQAWRRGAREVTRGAIAMLVAMIIAAMLGRAASGPMHLAELADPSTTTPNWAMAVEDAMHGVEVQEAEHDGAILLGLVPDADFAKGHSGYAGVVDYLGMEALADVGISAAEWAPIKRALMVRDLDSVCRHLEAHPGSLRVTGSDPAAGPDLLRESGCAADVVQRERWVSLGIDPIWLTGTPWADQPHVATARLAESGR